MAGAGWGAGTAVAQQDSIEHVGRMVRLQPWVGVQTPAADQQSHAQV